MMVAAAVGYALVGIMFLLLAILLSTSWRGQQVGAWLIAACLVNVAWASVLAATGLGVLVQPLVVFVAEIARAGAWVGFLVFLAAKIGISRQLRYLAVGIVAAVAVGGVLVSQGLIQVGRVGDIGQALFPGGLAIALIGLLLIEQVYRNSPPEAKWGLKALVLGLGGMFAYDLFLYSQAVLFNAIDVVTWASRGVVNVLFVPAIAIAARRNPHWELRIFVSRHVVFYSTTLVAVGAYLLLMSLGGYLLIQFGGSWGAIARVIFFAGAILVLLVLLFSSTLRARFKVFLSKHFFRNKYDYRDEWMRLVSTLGQFESYSTREVAIKAIAQIVDSPAGMLWVRDERESKYLLDARYSYSGPIPDIPFDDPLVKFVERDKWLVDLAEFDKNLERYQGLQLPTWINTISSPWLIIPLLFGEEILGLVLLTRAPGPPVLNYEDRDLLKTAGNHVAVHLAQARSEKLLTEAQQFEAYNKLTAFLMHDLNNLIAQQSLIVANAEKHKRNPEFVDDAINTIAGSVDRMNKVMAQLKRGRARSSARATEVRFLASSAVDGCGGRKPVPTLHVNGVDSRISVDNDEFIMVLTHLIRNAQDATPPEGSVEVELAEDDGHVRIAIRDTGAGMTPEFIRKRLFRPFDSTKGSEGMGIGAYQAREFARKLVGDLKVESAEGAGTTVTLVIPSVRGDV